MYIQRSFCSAKHTSVTCLIYATIRSIKDKLSLMQPFKMRYFQCFMPIYIQRSFCSTIHTSVRCLIYATIGSINQDGSILKEM